MTPATADLAERTLGAAELREVSHRIRERTHATIGASTRTRALTAVAGVSSERFELLLPSGTGGRLISGSTDRLGAELVGVVSTLERLTGSAPIAAPPPAVDVPPLAPGELLALAQVIREGDVERLDAALEELEMPGLAWWTTQFAWGAEAIITLQLTVPGGPGYATMLHLFSDGWGRLVPDANDDLTFQPMTTIEVQARINAFTVLLQESCDDDD